jgi:polysaccharide export outer membrane protein
MESQQPAKIFVVDDDPFSLGIYEQLFINCGLTNVKTFTSGIACLNALTEEPAIIFLEHSMEVMSGIEVLRKIKHFNPDIYVVFIAGMEDRETAMNSLQYGAFDYIIKGNNERSSIIKVLLKIQTVMEQLKKQPLSFNQKQATAPT